MTAAVAPTPSHEGWGSLWVGLTVLNEEIFGQVFGNSWRSNFVLSVHKIFPLTHILHALIVSPLIGASLISTPCLCSGLVSFIIHRLD
jgi:hypothetical protein